MPARIAAEEELAMIASLAPAGSSGCSYLVDKGWQELSLEILNIWS